MANSMPIPLPPRTPTPPPDDHLSGLGIPVSQTNSNIIYDPTSLSPLRMDTDSDGTPVTSYFTPATPDKSNPFNFQPAALAKSPITKSVSKTSTFRQENTNISQSVGQRRGHKYKHSSVSHQIFLEPPPRAPLALPNSLPIPTFSELRSSMTKDQKLRFYWSICHMAVAGYVAWNAHGSAAMEALSHLIFYDSLCALLCVFVEVLSNFEVWGRSSLRHPFGLQRMEVIAGFALSVLLIFFGFDLISHNAKHALEGVGHEPHHPHHHERVSAGNVDFAALLALSATLVSAVGLKNHARIGKAMRFAAMENLPSILSNPSHFLTLSCSVIMLFLPLLSLHAYGWVDKIMSLGIAVSMLILGAHLGRNVGSMLLMSYSGKGVPELINDIEREPLVKSVDHAKIWQAHYGVAMANLRLRVVGTEENLLKLRERITSTIRNRLGGGYGSGSQKWEVSVEFLLDDDHGHSHSHMHHYEFR